MLKKILGWFSSRRWLFGSQIVFTRRIDITQVQPSSTSWPLKQAFLGVLLLGAAAGCKPQEKPVVEKRPRPVTAIVLRKTPPPEASLVTASAGAWKTEAIGFEVSGRVIMVEEQNTPIEGRIDDDAGNNIIAGTPVARIDDERFKFQVMRAAAEVTRAEQNLIAAETELNEELPAKITAAVASRQLAETEFARSSRLIAQKAGAQSDLDRDRANRDNAIANVKQLEAVAKSKAAEIESLKSAILQAEQSQRDAQRNLDDCTLYSSFRGQVAAVSVVPGSIVNAGEPVVTLQMMDPLKVELEVSAQQSRQLQRTETYPIHVTMSDGTTETHKGLLHQIDAIADPLTRTYTLTLLVINKRLQTVVDPEVAITSDVWRLNLPFLPGAEDGLLFVEEKAILQDSLGSFMWMITNATIQSRSPSDHVLDVRKIRVTPKQMKVPYLGRLIFQEVVVDDDQFDPMKNLVVGRLAVAEGNPEDWDGNRVLVDSGDRWMLRPGDLVKVDLSRNEMAAGFYVPLDAIARRGGESAIFILEESDSKTISRRMPVKVVDRGLNGTTSSLRRIEPIDDVSLDGLRCIVKGAHYLVDGEPVNAVSGAERNE